MTRAKVLILVEGQTAETVVRDVIAPHLETLGCYQTRSIILETRRAASGHKYRGGVSTWTRISGDLRRLLQDSSATVVTTLLDYYGFAPDAPGMADRPVASPLQRVQHVEAALGTALGDIRFLPHLVLHEIEAWVLVGRVSLAALAPGAIGRQLERIVDDAGGPELVNDGPQTAPSKRIAQIWPQYQKVNHGPLIISDLGIANLRAECPHADAWLTDLEDRVRSVA